MPDPDVGLGLPGGALQGQGMQPVQQQLQRLQDFWNTTREEIDEATNFKSHQLPLARIKKIMKADEDVRMISQEAPVLFAKACEIFVKELTLRAWLHTEENKRKTLQRNDIAAAVSKTDTFDFLIDIVPRDDIKASAKKPDDGRSVPAELQQYYYQLAQQQAMAQQQHLQQQQVHQQQHQQQQQQHHQQQQVHQQHHQQQVHVQDPNVMPQAARGGQQSNIIDPYSFQLMYQQHQYRYLQQAHLMQTMQQVQPDDGFHPGERHHQEDY